MKSGPFSYYDFFGILAPGTVLLVGLLLLFDQRPSAGFIEGVGIGGLGILAILGYATGQMAQAFGNVFENGYWWFWDGMPSDWVRTGRQEKLPLSSAQLNQLRNVCTSNLGLTIEGAIQDLSYNEWDGITGQIYAAVEAEGQSQRLSTFNSNYGFHRGLTVAILLLAVAGFVDGRFWVGFAGLGAAIFTLYRMHRFARHYARELFAQAIQLPEG